MGRSPRGRLLRWSVVSDLLTTADAARELGVSPQRVRQLAVSRGVGQRIGRDWVFTRRDIEVLHARNRTVGRPKREDV